MSLFADARNDDFYNTDFLGKEDTEFINGFDFAIEQVKNLIENNLDVYETELTEVLEDGEEAQEDEVFSTREDLFDIVEENKELLSNIVDDWAEMERDELVASMIDNMDEDEYKKIRKKAIEKNGKEKYYDTRHYIFTQEKVFREE